MLLSPYFLKTVRQDISPHGGNVRCVVVYLNKRLHDQDSSIRDTVSETFGIIATNTCCANAFGSGWSPTYIPPLSSTHATFPHQSYPLASLVEVLLTGLIQNRSPTYLQGAANSIQAIVEHCDVTTISFMWPHISGRFLRLFTLPHYTTTKSGLAVASLIQCVGSFFHKGIFDRTVNPLLMESAPESPQIMKDGVTLCLVTAEHVRDSEWTARRKVVETLTVILVNLIKEREELSKHDITLDDNPIYAHLPAILNQCEQVKYDRVQSVRELGMEMMTILTELVEEQKAAALQLRESQKMQSQRTRKMMLSPKTTQNQTPTQRGRLPTRPKSSDSPLTFASAQPRNQPANKELPISVVTNKGKINQETQSFVTRVEEPHDTIHEDGISEREVRRVERKARTISGTTPNETKQDRREIVDEMAALRMEVEEMKAQIGEKDKTVEEMSELMRDMHSMLKRLQLSDTFKKEMAEEDRRKEEEEKRVLREEAKKKLESERIRVEEEIRRKEEAIREEERSLQLLKEEEERLRRESNEIDFEGDPTQRNEQSFDETGLKDDETLKKEDEDFNATRHKEADDVGMGEEEQEEMRPTNEPGTGEEESEVEEKREEGDTPEMRKEEEEEEPAHLDESESKLEEKEQDEQMNEGPSVEKTQEDEEKSIDQVDEIEPDDEDAKEDEQIEPKEHENAIATEDDDISHHEEEEKHEQETPEEEKEEDDEQSVQDEGREVDELDQTEMKQEDAEQDNDEDGQAKDDEHSINDEQDKAEEDDAPSRQPEEENAEDGTIEEKDDAEQQDEEDEIEQAEEKPENDVVEDKDDIEQSDDEDEGHEHPSEHEKIDEEQNEEKGNDESEEDKEGKEEPVEDELEETEQPDVEEEKQEELQLDPTQKSAEDPADENLSTGSQT
ncbi:hypothetical protein BLNAU_13209 [Blattamonas nauphoetae]|uniref:Uncharacterized protein n=1 Tax=Blattamonas nauphoetae TaxID=2049346 RepID=A0ABQ9XK29_9EUKA|nr:hypothetical protein BLNAU_13209 [Blattamonas nauphoetae]